MRLMSTFARADDSGAMMPSMSGELGFATGPYVTIATFCERALQEGDGVLSLMRVIDQINVQAKGPGAPTNVPPEGVPISVTLVIVLKAGDAHGPQEIRVEMESPDGNRTKLAETSVTFIGGANTGQNFISQLQMQVALMGLYWADVFINDRLCARAPLQISYGYQR